MSSALLSGVPVRQEFDWLFDSALTPVLRGYVDFARQEIVLPNGPYAGRKLVPAMQPAAFVWLAALDSGRWRRHAYVGPVQSGKTLCALVIPLMHVLFERCETAILGAPKIEIAQDKWREDFVPVIKASRYAHLLPARGAGSRGGAPTDHITFGHGVTLKFMSGQGSDDSRSAFTSRWAFITEVDKMDTAGEVSRESDPVSQIEDRTMAFDRVGGGGFVFLECTASISQGRIWQEYTKGTASQLYIPCPHCLRFVAPTRDNFVGWEDAGSEDEAGESCGFACSRCGVVWTEEERIAANSKAVLVHRGQRIDKRARVSGPVPRVRTLAFRASAANNAFVSDRTLAAIEWRGAGYEDESPEKLNCEKTILQKFWALPHDPVDLEGLALDWRLVRDRGAVFARGVVPSNTTWLTCGVDLRKRFGHWVLVAWRCDGTSHVVDYGAFDVPSDDLGVEIAMAKALADFSELCARGWSFGAAQRSPDAVWIDSNYQGAVVREFCRQHGQPFLPTIGRGTGQLRLYNKPSSKSRKGPVREIGNDYHITFDAKARCFVVVINADAWKDCVHWRLKTPAGKPGAMSLFDPQGDSNTHTSFSKHITAERQVSEFVVGKGWVTRWVTESRSNHWFDALYEAAAAADFCGYSFTAQPRPVSKTPAKSKGAANEPAMFTPAGIPFLATERR